MCFLVGCHCLGGRLWRAATVRSGGRCCALGPARSEPSRPGSHPRPPRAWQDCACWWAACTPSRVWAPGLRAAPLSPCLLRILSPLGVGIPACCLFSLSPVFRVTSIFLLLNQSCLFGIFAYFHPNKCQLLSPKTTFALSFLLRRACLCLAACDEACKTCVGPTNRDCNQCEVGWVRQDDACVGEAGRWPSPLRPPPRTPHPLWALLAQHPQDSPRSACCRRAGGG